MPEKKTLERARDDKAEGKSRFQCAGINRHEAEVARTLRERSSDPLGPEFCVMFREEQGEA
jgi:hypothetical protein